MTKTSLLRFTYDREILPLAILIQLFDDPNYSDEEQLFVVEFICHDSRIKISFLEENLEESCLNFYLIVLKQLIYEKNLEFLQSLTNNRLKQKYIPKFLQLIYKRFIENDFEVQ